MKRVVVDTSVLAALAFGESGAREWSERLDGSALFAPTLLQYELQSVARKKCRQHPEQAQAILRALGLVLEAGQAITWVDPDPIDVVLLANATGLTTYDAAYACLAGMLDADLLTQDRALAGATDPWAGQADAGGWHGSPSGRVP